jgi:XRE family transcriptional regulator, regulator of sulfur utilization
MKTWQDVKMNIDAISDNEKAELELMANIISQIVLRRKELNLSQKKLSEIIGIEKSTIGRIETLKNIPQLNTLVKILNVLDLEICVRDKSKSA